MFSNRSHQIRILNELYSQIVCQNDEMAGFYIDTSSLKFKVDCKCFGWACSKMDVATLVTWVSKIGCI